MKWELALVASCVLIVAGKSLASDRPAILLHGNAAQVKVDLAGGSIVDFRFNGEHLNPLGWNAAPQGHTAPRAMGHFLCLDRWGAATEAEQRHGMPYHGEATQVIWEVNQEPHRDQEMVRATMTAQLPLAGLKVKRTIQLANGKAICIVKEQIANQNKLGRIYNIVQHPSLGTPFLDETTIVDSNAGLGFVQGQPLPSEAHPAVQWPYARNRQSELVDMRYMVDTEAPSVVAYTIDEPYGWTTAATPKHGLLIGYLWKTSDYPWFDAWRAVQDGKPFARGLEFGTTGWHVPFPQLVNQHKILDTTIYEYLDADQSVTKQYAIFLFRIPKSYRGVARITLADGQLAVHERDADDERGLTMQVGNLFE